MKKADEQRLLTIAQELELSSAKRLNAMVMLGQNGSAIVVPVLLEVGSRVTEPAVVLRGVGQSLAALTGRGMQVSEFDMRNLTVQAYDAFCVYEA